MASSTTPRPAAKARTAPGPAGSRVRQARRLLLVATAMVVLGSFLPWVSTGLGNVAGVRGAGLWTFYAGMLGFAGAMLPWLRVAAVQGAVMAVVAIVLPLWQVVHLYQLVRLDGWSPGAGLVLVLLGGVLAAVAGWRLGTPDRG